MMISDDPPKNNANDWSTLNCITIDGMIATTPRNKAPGRVIREMTESMNSAVLVPGLTPGMNPPFFFISSPI